MSSGPQQPFCMKRSCGPPQPAWWSSHGDYGPHRHSLPRPFNRQRPCPNRRPHNRQWRPSEQASPPPPTRHEPSSSASPTHGNGRRSFSAAKGVCKVAASPIEVDRPPTTPVKARPTAPAPASLAGEPAKAAPPKPKPTPAKARPPPAKQAPSGDTPLHQQNDTPAKHAATPATQPQEPKAPLTKANFPPPSRWERREPPTYHPHGPAKAVYAQPTGPPDPDAPAGTVAPADHRFQYGEGRLRHDIPPAQMSRWPQDSQLACENLQEVIRRHQPVRQRRLVLLCEAERRVPGDGPDGRRHVARLRRRHRRRISPSALRSGRSSPCGRSASAWSTSPTCRARCCCHMAWCPYAGAATSPLR